MIDSMLVISVLDMSWSTYAAMHKGNSGMMTKWNAIR